MIICWFQCFKVAFEYDLNIGLADLHSRVKTSPGVDQNVTFYTKEGGGFFFLFVCFCFCFLFVCFCLFVFSCADQDHNQAMGLKSRGGGVDPPVSSQGPGSPPSFEPLPVNWHTTGPIETLLNGVASLRKFGYTTIAVQAIFSLPVCRSVMFQCCMFKVHLNLGQ